MSFFQFVSVRLSVFLIIGILLGNFLEPSLRLSSIMVGVLLALLILSYKLQKNTAFFGGMVGLTTCALGTLILGLSHPKNSPDHYSHHLQNQKTTYDLVITEVLKPTGYSRRYLARIRKLDTKAVSGKVLLSMPKDAPKASLAVDDALLAYGEFKEIRGPLNPHQFDYRRYMERKGIYHQLYLNPQDFVRSKKPAWSLLGQASNFRDFTLQKLKLQPFGSNEFAVMEAILLGQRNDLSDATYDNYKDAGAVHILALSGLHIGILLFLIRFLLSPLKRLPYGKQLQLWVPLLTLWAFAFVAGLSPSIVRAVTMFSFVAYALYLNRPTHTLNIIALSLFFLLLVRPLYLFQAGFQMSYAAVFAIVWLYPKLERLWRPKHTVLRKTWQLLAVSCTAQLGVLPISLFYFHQFPGLFFVSNLLIVPFLGIILGLGVLVLALSNLSILPGFLARFYNGIIKIMNQTIAWIAEQDLFVFKEVPFDGVTLVLSYVLIFALIFLGMQRSAKSIVRVLIAIVLLQAYALLQLRLVNAKAQFVVAHQTANTLLFHQQGPSLTVFHRNKKGQAYLVPNFKIAERVGSVSYAQLQNSYRIGDKTLYIMDSLAIYPSSSVDYLLMTQTPKVNMNRVLDSVGVGMVLVDGSNYASAVSRWKATCAKKDMPFHFTGEKGAFYINKTTFFD